MPRPFVFRDPFGNIPYTLKVSNRGSAILLNDKHL
jgi:hypothetical protein